MPFRLYSLLSLVLLLVGAASGVCAQPSAARFGFEQNSIAKVVQATDTLPHAWAGGLNAPQFSSIDLNYDGQLDLYAFDRETSRSLTFLNVAAPGGGRRWQYAPVYENAFPANLENWVSLRDYDCDGKADLFSYATGANIQVLRNVGSASTGPRFELAKNELSFYLTPGASYNLATGPQNMPTVQDVNGDGRLDIVTYDYISSMFIELYLNTGTGSCTDLNSFQRVSNYWGLIIGCTDCASYQPNGTPTCQALRITHSQGHNILLLDLNGDGVLDIIDGRDNCPQLSRLLNAGTNSVASFTLPNITSNFPLAAPLTTSVFPAPYSFDADFDGIKDLLVAANQASNVDDRRSMRHTVQQFRNTSASATAVPSYAKVSDGFLQNDMLDVSEGASPTFGDIDADGLTDMLVGNQGDLVNGYYRASLAYYRNVGTTARPVFRLITEDYLGLAATAALTPNDKFESLRPALVDLNRDGALDLTYCITTSSGSQLRFILNTAAVNQPVSFNPAQGDYFRPAGGTVPIAPYAGYTPCFFDIDDDGFVDLLLGNNDNSKPGSLSYFHNRGANVATNAMFTLGDSDYGTLRSNQFITLISPTVADLDGDGNPDLLTIDGNSTMRFYSNFRIQGKQFVGRTDLVYNSLTTTYQPARLGWAPSIYNMRYAPAVADLNRNGTPELYVGTEAGGIISYLPITRTVLATQAATQPAATLALSVFPNPASPTEAVTIETAQPTTLRVLDLTGRLLRQEATALRTRTLSLNGFAAGLYVVQATATDGTVATKRLVVGQ